MSELRPFRGLRFARALEPRLAGPYDVISEEERVQLSSVPENVVHLTLPPGPEGERDYASAAQTLERWVREGVLLRDPSPCLYVLEERIADGRVRRGFLGLLRLADFDEGVVLPHEHTMPGPKRDRLLLTRAVRANLEPLFFTYEDRAGKLDAVFAAAAQSPPLASGRGPDGTELVLYGVEVPEVHAEVGGFLADLPVLIADGHHRYETMLAYRDECRRNGQAEGPHDFVLGYLVNAFDPGSAIEAIHRVLEGDVAPLEPVLEALGFRCEPLAACDEAALLGTLAEHARESCAFLFARAEGVLLATRPREPGQAILDVEVLHEEVLPALGGELSFDARPARLLRRVEQREVRLGILLDPIDPDSLFRVIREGRRLPKKSTFFTPKIPSGLLIRDFS